MMRNRCEGGRFNSGSTKTKLQALKNLEERKRLKMLEHQKNDANFDTIVYPQNLALSNPPISAPDQQTNDNNQLDQT